MVTCLADFYEKRFAYKGFTIQPYSPAAGTNRAEQPHELNQPGAYKYGKDNTVVAQFKVTGMKNQNSFSRTFLAELYILAWTTTPWTLPSNTALPWEKNIDYILVKTYNPYTFQKADCHPCKRTGWAGIFLKRMLNWNLRIWRRPEEHSFCYRIDLQGRDFEGIRFEQFASLFTTRRRRSVPGGAWWFCHYRKMVPESS